MTEPIVFISNPRTGSYSVCEGLGLKHSHYPWYQRELGVYTFATVRNPWMQARSWFMLRKFPAHVTFEGWVLDGCPAEGTWTLTKARAGHVGEVPWWITCPPTEQLERIGEVCDDVFRLEDIADWWPKLASDTQLFHLGKTTNPPPFTEIAIDVIAERQAELIERFRYEPPKI